MFVPTIWASVRSPYYFHCFLFSSSSLSLFHCLLCLDLLFHSFTSHLVFLPSIALSFPTLSFASIYDSLMKFWACGSLHMTWEATQCASFRSFSISTRAVQLNLICFWENAYSIFPFLSFSQSIYWFFVVVVVLVVLVNISISFFMWEKCINVYCNEVLPLPSKLSLFDEEETTHYSI